MELKLITPVDYGALAQQSIQPPPPPFGGRALEANIMKAGTCGVRETHPRHRSDYKKYLPGQLVRIRLKIEQNCRLLLDTFSSAIINDLFTTFTSRLKVDAKCVYQHFGGLFWNTPSGLSAWVSVFLAWRVDLNNGVPTSSAYCEKLIWKFFFKFNQGTCPRMAFA